MTITWAPLPYISDLLGAVGGVQSGGSIWAREPLQSLTFSSGSKALSVGLSALLKYISARRLSLWVPGYFCNSALAPVRKLPIDIKFYRNCPDRSPDWEALESAVRDEWNPQVLLLVHYFGFPNSTVAAKQFCESHGMILFEDSAHVLCPNSYICKSDLQFFSPHKLLALPDGAILIASQELLTIAQGIRSEPAKRNTLQWIAKRVAQKGLKRIHFPWHLLRSLDRRSADVCELDTGSLCESYSLRLLARLEQQFEQIIAQRRQNYARLLSWLAVMDREEISFPSLLEGVCPYALPVRVSSGCTSIVRRLQSKGIPVSTWPDLPPEVVAEPHLYRDAVAALQTTMLVPIHQSLGLVEVDQIGRALTEMLVSGST